MTSLVTFPLVLLAALAQAPVTVEALVVDRRGEAVTGLSAADFEAELPILEAKAAGDGPRRLVLVFNRRGAVAGRLNRAKRGVEAFLRRRLREEDEVLFADLGETLRIGRGFASGRAAALAGLGTIPAMGYPSPSGARGDAAAARSLLDLVAERLAGERGRKIVVLYSGSLSSFSDVGEDVQGARSEPAYAALVEGFLAARAQVHVAHLAGVMEFEDRILTAGRGELIVNSEAGGRVLGSIFSSSTKDQRRMDSTPRSGDDVLSSLAADTGGLYLARTTDFGSALDRALAHDRSRYVLTLPRMEESGKMGIRVPACDECRVLLARVAREDEQ